VLVTLLARKVPEGTTRGIPEVPVNKRLAVRPDTFDVNVTFPNEEFKPLIVCPIENPLEMGDWATAGIKLLV
jgi:hypothetical protein